MRCFTRVTGEQPAEACILDPDHRAKIVAVAEYTTRT
jgi:hypothetical protein